MTRDAQGVIITTVLITFILVVISIIISVSICRIFIISCSLSILLMIAPCAEQTTLTMTYQDVAMVMIVVKIEVYDDGDAEF